jgi:hypothetical protein
MLLRGLYIYFYTAENSPNALAYICQNYIYIYIYICAVSFYIFIHYLIQTHWIFVIIKFLIIFIYKPINSTQ